MSEAKQLRTELVWTMLRDRPSFPVWFQNFPPHNQAIRQRANYLSLASKFLGTCYRLKQRDFITNEKTASALLLANCAFVDTTRSQESRMTVNDRYEP